MAFKKGVEPLLISLICLLFFIQCEGLQCRRDNDPRALEEFEDVVKLCARNNKANVNNRNKDMNPSRGRNSKNKQHGMFVRSDEDYTYDDDPEDRYKTDSKKTGHYQSSTDHYLRDTRQRSGLNRQTKHNLTVFSKLMGSPLEDIDPCLIHCIFRQMQMLNEDVMPDKTAIISVLTRRLRDPELRDFIQGAIRECFDMIDSDDVYGKCELSKNFALCLEEKGKMNCEDWDYSNNKFNNDRDSRDYWGPHFQHLHQG